MAELTINGLATRTLAEIKEELEDEQKATISPALDLSSTSLLGQYNAIIANSLANIEEALAGVYRSMDPNAAEGDPLDRIAAFTGTFRRAATYSSLSCSLFFSQTGTYPSGVLRANPVGSETSIFTNVSDVVVSSAPYTASNVLMRAIDSGPVQVILGSTGSGTLTEIASPVFGWDGLLGSSSLFIGSEVETDAELRVRRLTELFNPGSTSVDGIEAGISNTVSGVISVTVIENTASYTDAEGIPPYAIETIVYGPSADDDEIASTIFSEKAAGTPTYGNTSAVVTDDAANLHTIYFTRPVEVPVSITCSLTYRGGSLYAGNDTVRQTVLTNATSSWVPGLDVAPSQVSSWIQGVPGVLWITNLQVNGSTSVYSINNRQIAVITGSGDILITATQGTP